VKLISSTAFLIIIISSCLTSLAWAFPENIRHGYNNCTACHVSPAGGGMITPYGRSLSRELMSTWGTTNEEEVGHGWFKKREDSPFLVGGDFRAIQTYVNNLKLEQGKAFVMQSQVSLAYYDSSWIVLATAGAQGGPKETKDQGKFISSDHYLAYRLNDQDTVRVGKFLISYGIKNSNHTLVTRRGIGFDQGKETYNLEYSHVGDNWDLFLSSIAGRPDQESLKVEQGQSISLGKTFSDTYKIGTSFYQGANDLQKRNLFGVFSIFGITEKLYLMAEIHNQKVKSKIGTETETNGNVHYTQIGYELHKGFSPFIVYQLSHLDSSKESSKQTSHGLGLQWLPRPHFDLSAQWEKQNNLSGNSDFAWMMFHYYL
jgi:hypothetical protein